jgi:hypothetical protein
MIGSGQGGQIIFRNGRLRGSEMGNNVDMGILTRMIRNRGYTVIDQLQYDATVDISGIVNLRFTASRAQGRGRRATATGTGQIRKSLIFLPRNHRYLHNVCRAGQLQRAESLVISATVTGTTGGFDDVLSDARRELRRRGVPEARISAHLPSRVQGLSGSRVLVKVRSADFRHGWDVQEAAGECVSATDESVSVDAATAGSEAGSAE